MQKWSECAQARPKPSAKFAQHRARRGGKKLKAAKMLQQAKAEARGNINVLRSPKARA